MFLDPLEILSTSRLVRCVAHPQDECIRRGLPSTPYFIHIAAGVAGFARPHKIVNARFSKQNNQIISGCMAILGIVLFLNRRLREFVHIRYEKVHQRHPSGGLRASDCGSREQYNRRTGIRHTFLSSSHSSITTSDPAIQKMRTIPPPYVSRLGAH